jgi:hypothetical protein
MENVLMNLEMKKGINLINCLAVFRPLIFQAKDGLLVKK